jgi:hypothetical protein
VEKLLQVGMSKNARRYQSGAWRWWLWSDNKQDHDTYRLDRCVAAGVVWLFVVVCTYKKVRQMSTEGLEVSKHETRK